VLFRTNFRQCYASGMTIEIECSVESLFKVFESRTVSSGASRQVPGGGRVSVLNGGVETRHIPGYTTDAAPLITFALSIGKDIAVGLLSAWLYDVLKGNRIRTLRINREKVEISVESITQTVTKVIAESTEIKEE
jgi:hypothetical protein